MSDLKDRLDPKKTLTLMVTYACQLDCVYCMFSQVPRNMDEATLLSAIELILTSESPEVELQFMGGEPLLRFDLIRRAVEQGEARGREAGKAFRYMITTNGLLLDEEKARYLAARPVDLTLTLDISPEANRLLRPSKDGADVHAALLEKFALLKDSGIDFCVTVVLDPGRLDRAEEELELLERAGARRIQLNYRIGVEWTAEQKSRLLELCARVLRRSPTRSRALVNLMCDREPVVVTNEVMVDTDGEIFLYSAIFHERMFPELRAGMRLGRLGEIRSIDELCRSRSQVLDIFARFYPSHHPKGRVFLNNLQLGADLQRFLFAQGAPAR